MQFANLKIYFISLMFITALRLMRELDIVWKSPHQKFNTISNICFTEIRDLSQNVEFRARQHKFNFVCHVTKTSQSENKCTFHETEITSDKRMDEKDVT